jgi:hypothetical protein
MPAKQADAAIDRLAIQPIVIPRKFHQAAQRFHFYVVFSFIRDTAGGVAPRSQRPGQSVIIPPCLCDAARPWPTYVRDAISNQSRLVISAEGAGALQATKIRIEMPPDLQDWNVASADKLWRALVLPAANRTTDAAFQVSLNEQAAIDPRAREFDPRILLDATVEPWAASDLRPGVRIESVDSRLVAQQVFVASEGDQTQTEPLQALKNALTRFTPEQLSRFRSFVRQRSDDDDLWSLAEALRRNDHRFNEDVLPQLTGNDRFKNARDNLLKLQKDFALTPSQTEIRRQARFIQSARNREAPPANGNISLLQAQAAVDSTYDFERLMAMVRQHPGLTRRLWLTVSCSVAWDDLGPKPVADFERGTVSLQIPGEDDADVLLESPFLAAPTLTRFEFSRTGIEGSRPFFRPAASNPNKFFGADAAGARRAFRDHHALAPTLYQATQDDPSIAMARADVGLSNPRASAESAVGPASDASLHRVNAVNIYTRPFCEPDERATAATELLDRLKSDSNLLMAFNDYSTRLMAEVRRAASPFQLAGAKGAEQRRQRIARLRQIAPAMFSAENLMVGNSVFVQRIGKAGRSAPGPWRSLCRRTVTLHIHANPQNPAHPDRYDLVFEEEGFVASSVITPPRPLAGKVAAIDHVANELTIEVMDVDNQQASSERTPSKFKVTPDTRMQSLARSITEFDDVRIGDVVLVTPSGEKRDGISPPKCDEIAVYPILRVDGDPIKELVDEKLVSFGKPLLLACKNDIPGGGADDARKDLVLPVLIAPHSTRFVDYLGQPVIPRSEPGGDGARKDPRDFTHFTVEGSTRLFAQDLAPLVDPLLLPLQDKVLHDVRLLTNIGPVHTASIHHFPNTTLEFLQLPDPTAPLSDADPSPPNPFTEFAKDRMTTVARVAGDPLHVVRGRVTSIGFEVDMFVTRESSSLSSGTALEVMFGNVPWRMDQAIGPLVPQGSAVFALGSLNWPDHPLPEGVFRAVVKVVGVAKVDKDNGVELQATAINVMPSDVNTVSATAGRITWVLSLDSIGRGFVKARVTLSSNSKLDELAHADKRFIHPLDSQDRYVEILTYQQSQVVTAAGWPQRLFGTLVKRTRSESGSIADTWHVLRFPDDSVLDRLPAPPADVKLDSGFFDLKRAREEKEVTYVGYSPKPMVIVGEIASVQVQKPETPKSSTTATTPKDNVRVQLVDLFGQTWTIDGTPDITLHNGLHQASSRGIAYLKPGEVLIAACDLNDAPLSVAPRTLKWRTIGDTNIAQADTVLMGTLTSPASTPMAAAAEGSVQYRICRFRSNQGREFDVWSKDEGAAGSRRVVMNAQSVILGETLTQYVDTEGVVEADARLDDFAVALQDPLAGPKPMEPIHVMVSEIMARWGNWALTVAIPGESDMPGNGTNGSSANNKRLSITLSRPDMAKESPLKPKSLFSRDSWRLPALRFDSQYRFCIRRVDLAGNHYYDEDALMPEPTAVAGIGRLSAGGACAEAVQADGVNATNLSFVRTNLPAAPLVAFTPDCREPSYVKILEPASSIDKINFEDGEDELKKRFWVNPRVASKFAYLSFRGREPLIVLLSDVLSLNRFDATDAHCELLPPPCDVETVLMHGMFDGLPAEAVAKSIKKHEAFLEDEVLGCLAKDGDLNYFPDPDARELTIELKSLGKSLVVGEPKRVPLIESWPYPHWVRLSLWSAPRNSKPYADVLSAPEPELRENEAGSATTVRLYLPPGIEAEAIVTARKAGPVANDYAEAEQNYGRASRIVQVVHATNGALTRPVWTELSEKLAADPSDASRGRNLVGGLKVDRLTTGACSATAYWNDCWDESSPAQHEPGRAVVEVNSARQAVACHLLEKGFGFGSQAVVLFESAGVPYYNPVLVPVLKRGTLVGFDVVDQGCPGDVKYTIYVVPVDAKPRAGARRALATAAYGSDSRLKITIADTGACLQKTRVQIVSAHTPYPLLKPEIKDGQVCRVTMTARPGAQYPSDLYARIIRRPPFYRIAEGVVGRWHPNGGLQSIEVRDGGGWYDCPPFCIAHDPDGDGFGARLHAKRNDFGGVDAVEVVRAGQRYSDKTIIRFYTNLDVIPERAVDISRETYHQNEIDFSFSQSFDARARSVDYVANASSRFRKYLLEDTAPSFSQEAADFIPFDETNPNWLRRHVPRTSNVKRIGVVSQQTLAKPDVAYLMPAFQWHVTRGKKVTESTARDFFLDRGAQQIELQRDAFMRIYLHRPWHSSGPEQLAVIVAPAMLNTILTGATHDPPPPEAEEQISTLYPKDGGLFNPAVDADNPSFAEEPLANYVIDSNLRQLVSRWGFDPVWNEHAFPPLSIDHFSARTKIARIYDQLSEVDTSSGGVSLRRPLWLALHEVHYDSAKERWYADIKLDISAGGPTYDAVPFVRLGIGTYQPNGAEGRRLSPVTVCDMFKMLGKRTLRVTRRGTRAFSVLLKGEFDHAPRPEDFPRREVVVRLEARDPSLPAEVVHYIPANMPKATSAKMNFVFEQPLERSKKGGREYYGQVVIPQGAWDAVTSMNGGTLTPTLSITEYEIFPTAEAQADDTSTEILHLDGQLCARRLVFSRSFDVHHA